MIFNINSTRGHTGSLLVGTVSASDAEVVQEATSFMTACYGENKSTTMTAVRRRVWKGKTGSANIINIELRK